ncbi:hypothetical protein QTJ16_006814 [Diplocarpon rosae]|uniref:Uncharacterized protein n=1 Tax=Diplocarpon rosae TaxID=946125 RepID=A0AAD9SS19_9HELO|nr:hypothetical protein QTJ16_006814 [Diplocarpon rosae]
MAIDEIRQEVVELRLEADDDDEDDEEDDYHDDGDDNGREREQRGGKRQHRDGGTNSSIHRSAGSGSLAMTQTWTFED